IDDGHIVALTENGYEVKTLHDMGLSADLHSAMQLVNRLRMWGYTLYRQKPEDMFPDPWHSNTHWDNTMRESFFIFVLKVPLSFIREHPKVA
ncbi:unnamed protein product, partial [Symbiodinium pilosum]